MPCGQTQQVWLLCGIAKPCRFWLSKFKAGDLPAGPAASSAVPAAEPSNGQK